MQNNNKQYFFNKIIDTAIAYTIIFSLAFLLVSFIRHNDAQVDALLAR